MRITQKKEMSLLRKNIALKNDLNSDSQRNNPYKIHNKFRFKIPFNNQIKLLNSFFGKIFNFIYLNLHNK